MGEQRFTADKKYAIFTMFKMQPGKWNLRPGGLHMRLAVADFDDQYPFRL